MSRSCDEISKEPAHDPAGFSIPRQPPRGSARSRLPLDPHRPSPGARVALPSDSLGLRMEPLRPSKARTTLAPRRGTDAARPPAAPSAAGCAGAATAVAAASTADGPRGARRLVEVAAQTPDGGRPPAAAMRECASDARRGREGHTQGAVPTPCG